MSIRRNRFVAWIASGARERIWDALIAIASIGTIVAAWELAVRHGLISAVLLPAPSSVLAALIGWWTSGQLLIDLEASLARLLAGLALGSALGLAVGIWTGRSAILDQVLAPLFQLLRPLPPVAIIPLVILWLGIGETAKIFSIAFAVFFPVWLNTHIGASNIPIEYIRSAKIFSTSPLRTFLQVILPASLPAVYAGLRTGVAIAFVMVYVAEFAGASAGIGYEISVTYLGYRIDQMLAALTVLAIAGAVSDAILILTFRLLFPWMFPAPSQ